MNYSVGVLFVVIDLVALILGVAFSMYAIVKKKGYFGALIVLVLWFIAHIVADFIYKLSVIDILFFAVFQLVWMAFMIVLKIGDKTKLNEEISK